MLENGNLIAFFILQLFSSLFEDFEARSLVLGYRLIFFIYPETSAEQLPYIFEACENGKGMIHS